MDEDGTYPEPCNGKGFCYLPLLTEEEFKLPVHLNGAFQVCNIIYFYYLLYI